MVAAVVRIRVEGEKGTMLFFFKCIRVERKSRLRKKKERRKRKKERKRYGIYREGK